MKYNNIYSIEFSDSTTGGIGGNAIKTIDYTGEGGETSITITELIGKTATLLFRDGLYYTQTESVPATGKKYNFDSATGIITFSIQVPPLEPGELVTVQYVDYSEIVVDVEPITLAEAKLFARIDLVDDDDFVIQLITASRISLEQFTNLSFIPKIVTVVGSNEGGKMHLPFGPISGTPTVVDNNGTDLSPEFYGGVFKSLISPQSDNITIQYTAGYSVLPEHFKVAILNQIKYLYENRATGEAGISPIAKTMLLPLRMPAC